MTTEQQLPFYAHPKEFQGTFVPCSAFRRWADESGKPVTQLAQELSGMTGKSVSATQVTNWKHNNRCPKEVVKLLGLRKTRGSAEQIADDKKPSLPKSEGVAFFVAMSAMINWTHLILCVSLWA